MLQWLMEEAVGEEKKPRELTLRILVVSFAAIHTSSMVRACLARLHSCTDSTSLQSFAFALYRLAAYPEYAGPLREEIERVVAQEGWTKTAMGKMRKVDSFLRESQRMDGLGARTYSIRRRAPPPHRTDTLSSRHDAEGRARLHLLRWHQDP